MRLLSWRDALLTSASTSARGHALAISVGLFTLLLALVCLRSWVFLRYADSELDSDQAVFGLMAKDIALGRAYPLFTYGRRYMLAIGAWLCAPLFAAFGVSVTTLKLPMFAMNIGCVVMMWIGLRRERGMGPWGTTLTILPFAAASVVTASRLIEHAGGNIEPFFLLMLAFLLRERAIALGLVFGIAYLNREFSAIGFIALVLMDGLRGRLRERVKVYGIALAIIPLVVMGAHWLAEGGRDYYGPTVSGDLQNPFNGHALLGYFGTQLPVLLGTARVELKLFMESHLYAGMSWLGYGVVAWSLLGVAGIWKLRRSDYGDMSTYLVLIGLGQLGLFFLFCGSPWHLMLIRYVLLTLCLWVGLVAYAWKTPAMRPWIAVVVLTISACNVRDHIRVAREFHRHPPESENGQLAKALVQRGIRYANGNFWMAYATTFLTDERVIITPPRGDGDRMSRYIDELARHRNEVVTIQTEPCDRGEQMERWYLCPLARPHHHHRR